MDLIRTEAPEAEVIFPLMDEETFAALSIEVGKLAKAGLQPGFLLGSGFLRAARAEDVEDSDDTYSSSY